ncbi:MAG: dipeptide epimerase [Spirulinaceae cyanobacterium SM2_1_0]|nr:dipeptide epimerase [Spirulinaceae cyanobacterium SM2_1_0]
MEIDFQPFTVRKQVPLAIARGTSAGNTNLWLCLRADGYEGWGEATPFSLVRGISPSLAKLEAQCERLRSRLTGIHPLERQRIEGILNQAAVDASVRAAVDMALHDWLGKRVGLPLWQLWGLDRDRIVPTSVTIGISSPEAACERVQRWREVLDVQVLKVKLGSPAGLAADREMLTAVQSEAPAAEISVDANGGWSLTEAIAMAEWLAARGVRHLEQPLAAGQEADLLELSARSPLPIFADESCHHSQDILKLADRVQGVNLKIMKTGGLSAVQHAIHTARAAGLQVMFGCYSDSALANTAMAQLAPLADYLDLDSHLNLRDDPFVGATLVNGRLQPNEQPGLGVTRCA